MYLIHFSKSKKLFLFSILINIFSFAGAQTYTFNKMLDGYSQSPPIIDFRDARGLCKDVSGNIYVADASRIQKFSNDGNFIEKWGTPGYYNDNELSSIGDVAIDAAGNFFISNGGNSTIKKFSPTHQFISKWTSSATGDASFGEYQFLALDAAGNLFVSDSDNNRIYKFDNKGVFIKKWGSKGSGNGQLNRPAGIAVDALGNVYVADWQNYRIQKFDNNGTFISTFGSYGNAQGQFYAPYSIELDGVGNIYVGDKDSHTIKKFTNSEVYITEWGTWGDSDGGFQTISDITVSSSGDVFTADSYYNRIQKFNSTGTFIKKWGGLYGGGAGQFKSPEDVCIDASGNIYVLDTYNNSIQKFNSSDVYITKWGSLGTGNGQFDNPYGIAADPSGNIYVVDTNNDRIQKFTSDGTFISTWGTTGTGNGQFDSPSGITTDASGNVYIVDAYNSRIQKFTSNGVFITQWGSSGNTNGKFSSPTDIAVDIYGNVLVVDAYNHRVQKFSNTGTYISQWATNPSGDGQFSYPTGIATDANGDVFVVGAGLFGLNKNFVQKFSNTGEFRTLIGESGYGDGQFAYAYGIAVNNKGELYIADTNNDRVQKFSPSSMFTITTNITGSGTVTPASGKFNENSIQTLTATPSPGYTFTGWSGDATGTTNPLSVTMTANKTVTATFTINNYTLATTVIGSGTVGPASGLFNYNTVQTLTATPAQGYAFVRWSGDASGASNPLSITMTSNKNITAIFTNTTHSLTTVLIGSGTISPANGTFYEGTIQTLTATPATGYTFAGWSGDATGTSNLLNVTMSNDIVITATFVALSTDITNSTNVSKSIISPNPSNKSFNIELPTKTDVDVYTMDGKCLLSYKNVNSIVFGDELAAGLYIVKAGNDYFKIIKE